MNRPSNTNSLFATIVALALITSTHGLAYDGGSPFHCPDEHVYIHCGELHEDLDYYGYPKAKYGYKISVHGPEVHKHLDECGRGKIVRKWKIKYHYDWYWCEQTIHIKDPYGYGFDGSKIHWPKHFDAKSCDGVKEPDDMPYGHGWPEFKHKGCGKIGMHYKDEVHPYYGGGSNHYGYNYKTPCKVIHRKWEIIDWCQYDSRSYGSKGKWTYVQKIYIYDDVAPEITFCPGDTVVSGGDCDGQKTYIKLPKLRAHDQCGHVYYSYTRQHLGYEESSHYGGGGTTYGGSDASGYYLPGKTLVTFKAFDVCGNATTCDLIVEVKAEDSKPPTVIGISSLTAVLMQTDTHEGMVELWPEEFNTSSYDNCTSPENLKFSLEPNIFTCEDIGSNEVKFIVEDEAGNSDYIKVEVIVQVTSFECMGAVAGQVLSDNLGVTDVEISSVNEKMQMTDEKGQFRLEDIPVSNTIDLHVYKNSDHRKGIDIYDQLLLSWHVDGIKKIKEPKKLVAADIDGNKVIDMQDVYALQRLIYGIEKEFKSNTSWKFIPEGFVFPDTLHPLQVELPSMHTFTSSEALKDTVTFEGIKIGDIGSLTTEQDPKGRNTFVMEDLYVQSGEEVLVPVYLAESTLANTFSFEVSISDQSFDLISIVEGQLEEKGTLEFMQQDGFMVQWFSMAEASLSSEHPLFFLKLQARKPTMLSSALRLDRQNFLPTSVSTTEGVKDLDLRFSGIDEVSTMPIILQNSPNPFFDQTIVQVYLPKAGEVVLNLVDMAGRVVLRKQAHFGKGLNQFEIERSEITGGGLHFYQVQIGDEVRVKKMMVN